MGFYGNITNTSKTQFQFDKIYSNRKAMEQAKITDGIYLGRYVLVEYDDAGLDGMKQVYIKDNKFYTAPSYDNSTRLNNNNTVENEVVYYIHPTEGYLFYKRTSTENNGEAAEFSQITNGSETAYVRNFNIDKEAYGAGRGYDSTVWQKVYSDEQERYVMIAELNTVVPTFAIAADAPTMTPVTPHFDTQSTDVYYKLHMQNPWIVRVAEAKNGAPSDATIEWQEVVKDENQEVGEQYEIVTTTKNGAIYFNKAAFDSQVGESTIAKKVGGENKITIDLVSSGLELYDDHNNTTDKPISADDIQELTINLPAIGNMMSDAWDIIHGSKRDDSMAEFELDEQGNKKLEDGKPIRIDSLQGRLDSIAAIGADEIPVKRSSDGALVGASINGGRTSESILTGKNDDNWIETMVNGDIEAITIKHTFNKVDDTTTDADKNDSTAGDGDNKGSGDTLKLYTPHVDDMGHVVGKNIETVTLPYGFKTIKTNGRSNEASENATGTPVTADVVADNTQDELTINSGNKWIRIDTDATGDSLTIRHDVHETSNDDNITNWTETEADTTIPVVTYEYDEAGHYVKHHTEYYQLPFGYGKIKGDKGNTAATATYDEVTFTSDEWLTAAVSKDTVTYSHDYPKKVDDTKNESDVNGNGDTIVLETLSRDEKGHVTKVNQNTVTLPYGFKTIAVGNESDKTDGVAAAPGSVVAHNTQDTLAINPGNKWIHIGASDTNNKDTITLSHEVNNIIVDAKTDTDLNDGTNTITIQDTQYDNAGHVTHNQSHTYTLPYGYKTFTGDSGSSSADNTQDTMAVNGDDWIQTKAENDKLTFTHIGPVDGDAKQNPTNLAEFGKTFTINDHYFDDKGHKYTSTAYTVTIPLPSLTNGTGNVVTGLSLTPATGAFVEAKDNISNILLTGYSKETNSANIAATDSLGTALSKLQTQIHDTETTINNLDYSETADNSQIITQITQTDGKITSVARAAAGTLVLGSGYSIAKQGDKITAKDSLNTAFGKLETSLAEEKARAEAAEGQVLVDAKAYTDAVKKAILTGDSSSELSDTYDTLLEISNWINGDGVNATELSTALAEEAQLRSKGDNTLDQKIDGVNKTLNERINNLPTYTLTSGTTNGTVKFNNNEVKVAGLGSAAYTNSDNYATAEQGTLANTAIQPNTLFTYGNAETQKTIENLFEIVASLEAEIKSLKEQIKDYHSTEVNEPEGDETTE